MKYVVFEKEGSSTKYCVFAGEALPPWATNIASLFHNAKRLLTIDVFMLLFL